MGITPEKLNAWRIIPRILAFGYGAFFIYVAMWFMGLDNPTTAQSAFVSTMSAATTGVFGFYVNSGGKPGRD